MLCVVRYCGRDDNSINQAEFIYMKTDAISSYEGSCQGRLSNPPREQSKHRWREGDGLKLIGKKVRNTTDIHLAFWEEDKRELVTAEIKVEPR